MKKNGKVSKKKRGKLEWKYRFIAQNREVKRRDLFLDNGFIRTLLPREMSFLDCQDITGDSLDWLESVNLMITLG